MRTTVSSLSGIAAVASVSTSAVPAAAPTASVADQPSARGFMPAKLWNSTLDSMAFLLLLDALIDEGKHHSQTDAGQALAA